VGKRRAFKPSNAVVHAEHHVSRGAWIVLGDLVVYLVEIIRCVFADDNFHMPYRCRKRSVNSARVIFLGFGSAKRR
jgi:hypothetical protein